MHTKPLLRLGACSPRNVLGPLTSACLYHLWENHSTSADKGLIGGVGLLVVVYIVLLSWPLCVHLMFGNET